MPSTSTTVTTATFANKNLLQELHQLEQELNVEILPGTEVMRDVGSHHFVKSSANSDKVLVPQPSADPNDPLVSGKTQFVPQKHSDILTTSELVYPVEGPRHQQCLRVIFHPRLRPLGACPHVRELHRRLQQHSTRRYPVHWCRYSRSRFQQSFLVSLLA